MTGITYRYKWLGEADVLPLADGPLPYNTTLHVTGSHLQGCRFLTRLRLVALMSQTRYLKSVFQMNFSRNRQDRLAQLLSYIHGFCCLELAGRPMKQLDGGTC